MVKLSYVNVHTWMWMRMKHEQEWTDVEDEALTSDKHEKLGNRETRTECTVCSITPKVFLWVQENLQYVFWCAHKIDFQPSLSHQLSFHTKTRTTSYMHIFSILSRLYHINSEIDMHIFGRLYHINSETDMHIFSCLGRLYHINSQIFVYAFAPSRVLLKLFSSLC